MPPELQLTALVALHGLLKQGGRVLFRDYAVGDMAQTDSLPAVKLRKITSCAKTARLRTFFDETRLHTLMTEAGFEKVYCRRVDRLIKNRKEGLQMERVFLQAEYMKQIK